MAKAGTTGYYIQEKAQKKSKYLTLEHTFLPFLRQGVDLWNSGGG